MDRSDGFSNASLAGAIAGGTIGSILAVVVRSAQWRGGDEPTIAALLIVAGFASLASLALACVSMERRGIRSGLSWLALLLAVSACVLTLRTWRIL